MKAHLLTIGDELLIGQTTNTNATWLGEALSRIGVHVERSVTVGDDADAITRELDRSYEEAQLVITTGGLGPTHDDVTKSIVSEYFDAPLETDDELLERVRQYYERRGREMPPEVADLATVPRGFEKLENKVGTAVGLWYAESGDDGERLLAVLPGVPDEMRSIYDNGVEPRLSERADLQDLVHKTLLTTGVPESSLQQKIGDLSDWLDGELKLAYLPSTSGVRLRLTAMGRDRDVAERRIEALEEELRDRIGKYIFGTGKDTLEGVVGDLLREHEWTVATAESATGGLIGHRLTSIAGSSDYFVGGVISYANEVKINTLGVSASTLKAHGAVSQPVAEEMAAGAATKLGATIGISTSGIAGPGGGTEEKPVGTLCVGFARREDGKVVDLDSVRLQLTNDRVLNKELFATSALEMIRRKILW
ncbi:competence/damage-inducible protein A [Longibacter salinarum]|uniref:CinA-like protein n=1 Tax=Longibacter salinarum TaxID=1850348 RepID=A0A2A8D1W2_9BACT|nr:competence/damage-inducible protein A [Longibacter salinarum]PEN14925.1 competence/damage-inducible protein A [Longibacter salinarum]